ncbi:MAG: carboxypeptidase regulatory-like domain-containing protein [Candidatus Omnitrophota bacterium]
MKRPIRLIFPLLLAVASLSHCSGPMPGSLEGVVQLENRADCEGVQVILPGTQFRAITGQSGAFVITGIPPGAYTYLIENEGYVEHRGNVDIPARSKVSIGSLTLMEKIVPAGQITGFVTLQGESIHEGILVILEGTPFSVTTNTTGLYHIENIPPAKYRLVAVKENLLPVYKDGVEVNAGAETHVPPIVLSSAVSLPTPIPEPPMLGDYVIKGVAFLDGESSHAGIKAALEDIPEKYAITDASGEFKITGMDAVARSLILTCTGFLPETLFNAVPSPATAAQSVGFVSLQREFSPAGIGVLQGRVYLSGGTDHSNTIVALTGISLSVSTDANGRYMFVGIPAGEYSLTAKHPGYADGTLSNVSIQPSRVAQAEDLVLALSNEPEEKGKGIIEGSALLEDASDHGGITVAIQGTAFTAVTGKDGEYRFTEVPFGAYTIIFSKGEYKNEYLEGVLVLAGKTMQLDPVVLKRDIEPPYVVDTFPRDGARRIPVDRFIDIVVRFSERMEGESVKSAVLIDPPVSFDAFFDRESEISNSDILHLRLYQDAPMPIRLKTRYTITLTMNAQTPKKVSLAQPFTFSFTTDGPLIVRTFPEEGTNGVILGLEQNMMLETNSPVDPVSFERALRFRPNADSQPLFQFIPNGSGTRIVMNVILKPNTSYHVQLDNNLRTIDRQRFSNTPYTLSFRTGGAGQDANGPNRPMSPRRR